MSKEVRGLTSVPGPLLCCMICSVFAAFTLSHSLLLSEEKPVATRPPGLHTATKQWPRQAHVELAYQLGPRPAGEGQPFTIIWEQGRGTGGYPRSRCAGA